MKTDVSFPRASVEDTTVEFDRTPCVGEWIWYEQDWWQVVRVLWQTGDNPLPVKLLTQRVYGGSPVSTGG